MKNMRENIFSQTTNTTGDIGSRVDGNDRITVKILSGGLDTKEKRGMRPRLLRDLDYDTPRCIQ